MPPACRAVRVHAFNHCNSDTNDQLSPNQSVAVAVIVAICCQFSPLTKVPREWVGYYQQEFSQKASMLTIARTTPKTFTLSSPWKAWCSTPGRPILAKSVSMNGSGLARASLKGRKDIVAGFFTCRIQTETCIDAGQASFIFILRYFSRDMPTCVTKAANANTNANATVHNCSCCYCGSVLLPLLLLLFLLHVLLLLYAQRFICRRQLRDPVRQLPLVSAGNPRHDNITSHPVDVNASE